MPEIIAGHEVTKPLEVTVPAESSSPAPPTALQQLAPTPQRPSPQSTQVRMNSDSVREHHVRATLSQTE
jgi:hypothetical protein